MHKHQATKKDNYLQILNQVLPRIFNTTVLPLMPAYLMTPYIKIFYTCWDFTKESKESLLTNLYMETIFWWFSSFWSEEHALYFSSYWPYWNFTRFNYFGSSFFGSTTSNITNSQGHHKGTPLTLFRYITMLWP